jgi:hypothetical protein
MKEVNLKKMGRDEHNYKLKKKKFLPFTKLNFNQKNISRELILLDRDILVGNH